MVFNVETKSKASPFHTGETRAQRLGHTLQAKQLLSGGISVLILFSTIRKPMLYPLCSHLSKSALKDKEAKYEIREQSELPP